MRRMPSTSGVLPMLSGCRLNGMMPSTVRSKLRSSAAMVFWRTTVDSGVSMPAALSTMASPCTRPGCVASSSSAT